MVLAAGLGTRLRPLTYAVSKPMVPVLERPVMAHIVALLERHGIGEVVANLHYFPEPIRRYFGSRLQYSFEQELLGTAGGVRACRRFFGEETFLVISGDALTDIDLTAFVRRHQETGGVATLAVKEVADTSQYGVVMHDGEGRVVGFEEKPPPARAGSRLGNCGIYLFEPEVFNYFPEASFCDFAQDVFPRLLDAAIPFYIHPVEQYWNDIGSLAALKEGTFDALAGRVAVAVEAREAGEGLLLGPGAELGSGTSIEGPVLVGAQARVGAGTHLYGPLVIGPGAVVGEGAYLKEAVVMPGAKIGPQAIVVDGIVADREALANPLALRRGAA